MVSRCICENSRAKLVTCFRDNEKPSRKVVVPAFKAAGRPITNEEYARYLEQTHGNKLPASWTERTLTTKTNGHTNGYTNGHTNGYDKLSIPISKSFLESKMVRTVYGLTPLQYALDWPIFASYDELAGCAKWMGGRIPTFEEAKSIYHYADVLKLKQAERQLGKTVPAVNGCV